MKKRAVVVCPGRGTYTKETLGYLTRFHDGLNGEHAELLAAMDNYRQGKQQPAVTELDSATDFRINQHLTGDNASALIYACAMTDFLSIDRERYDIVAVTGNSMGWYLALACAEAVSVLDGFHIVNTMGTTMHERGPGGQVIFPLCDEQWQEDIQLKQQLAEVRDNLAKDGIEIFDSIFLGGMRVLAAEDHGIKQLLQTLPKVQERYPFALAKHGAFHTPLMNDISNHALGSMDAGMFTSPSIPLVDGRGHIWQNYQAKDNHTATEIFNYTFAHQVVAPYDYSTAIDVAVKEFAPDNIIILGPGSTLGAPTAQQLIHMRWLNLLSKDDFKQLQANDPFILSMGMEEQRVEVYTKHS